MALLESIVTRGSVTRRRGRSAAVMTQALDWPGLFVEAGRNDVAAVDDLVADRHFLSLNLDTVPLTIEVKEARGFKRFTMPPRSAWVNPSAEPVTLRVNRSLAYLRVALDPLHLARLLAPSLDELRPVRLRRTYGIQSPQLTHLMLALRNEAEHTAGGLPFVESVTTALGHVLMRHAGIAPARPRPASGGLSTTAQRRVLELIDARLDARLTVEMLAAEAGLSPAHFAHAFKASLGQPPHRYVLTLRLERARRLLDTSCASLSDVAQRAGFSDQAHLTRLFKRAFGITPGAIDRNERCA